MRDYIANPHTDLERQKWERIERRLTFVVVPILGAIAMAIFFYAWTGMPNAGLLLAYWLTSMLFLIVHEKRA